MSIEPQNLEKLLREKLGCALSSVAVCCDQITLETTPDYAHALFKELKHDASFQFDTLIDICGVDYLEYGVFEWETEKATVTGFGRAVEKGNDREVESTEMHQPARFAVVYHLLSTTLNQRLRVRVFLEENLLLDSVSNIWSAANWFEREAYDMFGILFKGHTDLRRILTDYGFIGYPFRKDFPLSGHVEVRYDAKVGRVVYAPVDIQPRTLVPKVKRTVRIEEVVSNGN